jgi:Raf kinase inhibitor-like YbhB/YbcL family protein
MAVKSSAFGEGAVIPTQYTGDGRNISPPLRFEGIPANAKQLALIVDDPDAPRKDPWVHWVMYGIPASTKELPEHVPQTTKAQEAGGALQGKNSWGGVGYRGPEPPRGHGIHHYHFKVYALDSDLPLQPGLEKEALLNAIQGHVLAEASLVGTYQR